jgi:type I restriction enzyme S subunit
MRRDWTFRPLGELVNFASGGTPSKHKAEYWIGDIPWISAKSLKNERIKTSDLFISEDGLNAGSKLAPCGSILLLTRGSGLFNGIPVGLVEKEVAFNQDIKCLNSCSEVENKFIFYWLLSQRNYLMAKVGVTGIGAGKFDLDFLQKLDVPVPSVQVRSRIIAIGATLSDKIELNQKINDNLQQQAFTLFDRFLSVEHSSKCPLSQIAIINPKRILKKGKYARYIDMAQLSTSGSFPNGWEIKPYNGGMRFSNGDTLLARITPCLENGKTAYIDFLGENEVAFGSTEYVVISSRGEYPPEFFYCLARCPSFVDYAVKNMNGSSGRQRVSAETIGNYLLPALTEGELQEFRSTVPCLFKMIRNNAIESMVLTQLRDSLLPRLISGEIDVSNIKC